MRKLREHILTRLLCGLVAAIILNFSVDAPDMYDNHIPENLAYNDIESVVEWVLEDVCQIAGAIAEQEDNDHGSPLKFEKHIDFFYPYFQSFWAPLVSGTPCVSVRNFGDPKFTSQNACDELIQPPEA